MDLKESVKDKLIREVSQELQISEDVCKLVINHQFNMVKLFIHTHDIGEIHLPSLGRLVSTEKNVGHRDRAKKIAEDKKLQEA